MGERAYLARLRCADGRAPQVLGRYTGPPSPFGGVSDVYGVQCAAAAAAEVHMRNSGDTIHNSGRLTLVDE